MSEFLFPNKKTFELQGFTINLSFLKRPFVDNYTQIGIKIPISYEVVGSNYSDSLVIFAPLESASIHWEMEANNNSTKSQGIYVKLAKESMTNQVNSLGPL